MRYKNVRVLYIISLSLLLLFIRADVDAAIKEKTKTIGNFKYTYTSYQSSYIWITEIKPLSNQGIGTLKIPSYIDGKKVVKIGNKFDNDSAEDTFNVFGMWHDEETWKLLPKKTVKRVKKIDAIILPKTIKKITPYAFSYLQKGKTINIPKGVTVDLTRLIEVQWKRITVSKKNPKYRVYKGILLSKDGEKMYGLASSMKKVVIPDGVKVVENAGPLFSVISDVYIPASVKKIDFRFWARTSSFVKIHVSELNPYYAVSEGCLYHKKSRCLIIASTHSSTFTVPPNVACIENPFFTGKLVNRIIIPPFVKIVGTSWGVDTQNLSYEFQGEKPPYINVVNAYGVTFYVPKGSISAYKGAVAALPEEIRIYEK